MANLQRENIELDKYTIGGEKGSPIGGAYFHVKEEEKPSLDEAYNVSIRGDIDDIDSIEYEPNDVQEDEDDEDFEPTYDINAYDNEGEYVLCGELTIDEILDYFDEDILNMLTNHEGRKISSNIYRIDDLLMRNTTPSDVNNVEEVNRIAKKIATGGPSQYLLVDGELIAFHDHIYITSVDGMTPSKFLSLGNIRLGSNSIELMKEPTREQCVVLKQFIQGKKEIYLDISKYKEGSTYGANIVGACYNNPNPNRVVNDIINYFENGIKPLGNMAFESRRRYKYLVENLGLEVSKGDVDLSTLSKKNSLNPNIWDGMKLNPKIRLKLLDIADDFWEFVDVKWVDPISIILTGSICNFNWSDASDIDLHLVVDYSEVDEKTEFVKQFFDMKKNEWNENHSSLEIMGFNVELYVQDSNADLASQGVYDLEENKWISEPSMPQGNFAEENENAISDLAAKIMTLIDELENEIAIAKDTYKSRYFGELASEFVSHIHKMRHDSLEKQGEDSIGNMVYKVLRRSGYIDKIYDAIYLAYDKENSLDESKEPLNEYDVYYECMRAKSQIGGTDAEILELLDSTIAACDTPYTNIVAPYFLARALQYDKMTDYRKAMLDFFHYEALMYPNLSAEFYYIREQSEMRGKLYQPALNDIAHAVALDPKNTLYWAELASANLRVKKIKEAIVAAEQCIKLEPEYPDAYLVLGLAQIENGDKAEGIKNIEKAKSLGNAQADKFLEKYK